MIYTKEVLDRETHPFYWLTVYAQDSGLIPLSSFTEVYIEVDDINDNAPQTSDPVYYPTVPEQSPEGTSVFRLEAFDHDSTANGALTYEITSGNPQGFFVINRTTGMEPRQKFV
jgi:protocadherin Fat 1/2/3